MAGNSGLDASLAQDYRCAIGDGRGSPSACPDMKFLRFVGDEFYGETGENRAASLHVLIRDMQGGAEI